VAKDIIAKDGFASLYRGLSAGLLRQATYTTARLGIFSQITEAAKKANGGKNLPLWQKALCGLTAGGLGALVGTPADLTLIRMQVRAWRVCGCVRWVCALRRGRQCAFVAAAPSLCCAALCWRAALRVWRIQHAVPAARVLWCCAG
jgi:hypothetical protein